MRVSRTALVFAAGLLTGVLLMPMVHAWGESGSTSAIADQSAPGRGTSGCDCPGDIAPPGGDGVVNLFDLLELLDNWGTCPAADSDNDGVPDNMDNCPNVHNPTQADADTDGVGDVCDNCPFDFNPSQTDADGDLFGAACDCDDTNASVNPNAVEVCNLIDDDCNMVVDDGCMCPPGFADCNGVAGDGCEVDILNNPNHCGSCNVVCPVDHICLNGTCVLVCPSGFLDCNGNPNDGCETDVLFDDNNCGSCGVVCPPGFSCINGTCVAD